MQESSNKVRFAVAGVVVFFFAAFAVVAAAPAYSQGAAALLQKKAEAKASGPTAKAAEHSVKELEALARTLEDDKARTEFLATLKGLIAARKAAAEKDKAPSAANGLAGRIAAAASRSVQAFGDRVAAVVGVLKDAPRLLPWLETWITEPAKRDRLIGLIWRFLVIVGLGMGGQYLFRRLTGHWRGAMERDEGTAVSGRIVRFVLRTLLLYGNALAYGAGAYAGYIVFPMSGIAGQVLLVGAASFFVAKLILATTRVFLAPGAALIRPLRVSDETAHYLYLWVRRLVRIFVYAFFFLKAAQLVGLPEPAYQSLLYIVGFALVAFLIVFVLQNRAPVAEAIRGKADQAGAYGGLRARLAATWHVFTNLYILAVYAVWLFQVEGGFEFLISATVWTALAVVVAKALVIGTERGIERLFDVSAELDRRYPGLEERANRYVPMLNKIIAWVVYIAAAVVAFDAWGMDTLAWLASDEGAAVLRKGVTVAFVLLVAIVVWEAINLAIGRYLDRMDGDAKGAARVRTLLPLIRTTALILIVVIASLVVLSEIGFNIGPLLAGAGVIGLAIGFGSQKLVQDVITGLFILIEDTLAVGDVVRLDSDHSGVVEALSIRSVRLRDLSGNVHTLPFSEVKTILNMTKDWSYYVFEVGVAYRENVDHVMAVLRDIGEELQKDEVVGPLIMEPLEVLGLDKFADSAIIIKARIKVNPPVKQWQVGREFNRRMKARFDEEGIEIPFPHQTVYFGEDREGNAPPAHVAMVDEAAEKARREGAEPQSRHTPQRARSGSNVEDGEGDL